MKNPVVEDAKDGVPPGGIDDAAGSNGAELPPPANAQGVTPGSSRAGVWRFPGASARAPESVVAGEHIESGDNSGNVHSPQAAVEPPSEQYLPVSVSEPVASEVVDTAPPPQPEADLPTTAVIDTPRTEEPASQDVTTITDYDFTPRPDLLVADRDTNPFSTERTWLDRFGGRSLALGLGMGTLAIALAWALWPGATDQKSNSVAVLGTKAQVAAVVKPVSPPTVEAPPPAPIPPTEQVGSPVVIPEPAVVPAPPLVTMKPEELTKVEPVIEEIAEPVVPVKPAAKPQRIRKVVQKPIPKKPVRVAAKEVQKPVRKVAKAKTPVRATEKPRVSTAAVPTAAPVSARAELLKACRAYGYHAELCIQRGCKLTKFGLACTGR